MFLAVLPTGQNRTRRFYRYGHRIVVGAAVGQRFCAGWSGVAAGCDNDRAAIAIAALVLHNRMSTMERRPSTAAALLTPRERDCIGYIAEGQSDNDIADRLGISVSTVITHVQNARRKLGAKTRAQAVAVCLASGGL